MYVVESYDNWDAPAERQHLKRGEFASAEEAIDGAFAVIEESLNNSAVAKLATAKDVEDRYLSYGEVPMIFGDPEVRFDPYGYVRRIAPALVARNRASQ